MDREFRVIIADRSELAYNMYRLLLQPLGANLLMRKRFEAVRPYFFRRERVDLGIFNSNIFGKRFTEIYKNFEEVDPLRDVQKIFICKDSSSESHVRKELELLSNSRVVLRPFHPDEFSELVLSFIT